GTFSGISDQGPAASASSATTTPADDVEAIMRARVEGGASPSPTSTEAPATPDVQPPAESEQSHTETEDTEWADALAAEIDALDTLSEEEVEALRQGHALDRHPRDPETLLAAIV